MVISRKALIVEMQKNKPSVMMVLVVNEEELQIEEEAEICEYEHQRNEIVAFNCQRMRELGLPDLQSP